MKQLFPVNSLLIRDSGRTVGQNLLPDRSLSGSAVTVGLRTAPVIYADNSPLRPILRNVRDLGVSVLESVVFGSPENAEIQRIQWDSAVSLSRRLITPHFAGKWGSRMAHAEQSPLFCPEQGQIDLNGAQVLGLDFGVNTIQGSSFFSVKDFIVNHDVDEFTYLLPLDGTVGSVTYSFAAETNTNVIAASVSFGGVFIGGVTIVLFGSSPVDATADLFSVTFGGFVDEAGNALTTSASPALFEWNYTWTFDVTRDGTVGVPEPGTLATIGAGLAMAWFARRRRKSRQ